MLRRRARGGKPRLHPPQQATPPARNHGWRELATAANAAAWQLDALDELVFMCARMVSAFAGLPILVFLSLLAWIAAVAAAGKAGMADRVELCLTSFLLWAALIALPAYVLGWANWLYPHVLAGVSLALSAGILVIAGLGRSPRAHARRMVADLLLLAKLPLDGLGELLRTRGFGLIGILLSMAAVFWTTRLSYLGPPAGWDGLWYQDTMVGFAIQNHGFRLVDLPTSLAGVNSLPRICESLILPFVMFGGRRLVAVPNSLMVIPLLCAVYLLIRRYASDREYGVACASGLVLMPGVMLQLRNTTIDLTAMALLATALHFATRPHLRLRDAWLGAGALGLLLGTRFDAVVPMPILALVLTVRLIATHFRPRPAAAVATALGGAALMLAIGAPNYLRNWHQYHNLFWPHTNTREHLAAAVIIAKNAPRVVLQLFEDMLSPPLPGRDWPDAHQHGYGLGMPALVLPLGLLAAIVAALAGIRAAMALQSARQGRTVNLLYTALPMLATAPVCPQLSYSRHNIHIVIALLVLTAWLVGRAGWERLRHGVGATLVTTSIVLLWWASPRWFLTLDQAVSIFGIGSPDRVGPRALEFLPAPTAASARETELKAGDLVVFTESCALPAVNWNEHFTNRIAWVSSTLGAERVLQRAAELGAKWITVPIASPEYHLLRTRTDGWQEVGHLTTAAPAHLAFRRLTGS